MSVAIAVEAASKRYGAHEALRGVTLDVAPGELVALLGPSGSGKTTLLRVIAGLERADSGRVLFDGVDAGGLSLAERRIGFVFQNYALFRHMNVADNIGFGLRARPRATRPPRADIARRVRELLELVQLSGLGARFPSQLSGGQRQRVALSRALAIEPKVLLLDEPFGALDAKVRKELRAWLRDLLGRIGHTSLFVTHDQDEALELADRVAILNDGVIEQVGAPDDVYDRPATPFVCEFLGEANRVPVEIRGGYAFFRDRPVFPAPRFNRAADASLYVRPHGLRLVEPSLNALVGRVGRVRRHGSIRRAEVAVDGVARNLDVDVLSEIAPASGETVGLRVAAAHVFAKAG